MLLDEKLLKHYLKKVMGFAFSKTQDPSLAEDLAQDIMLQLTISLSKNPEIENINGYIYTLCCHIWSKYLRGNKKHWDNSSLDLLVPLDSEINVEKTAIDRFLVEKMMQEISYLTATYRKIIIMFYFDNLKTTDIATELNLKPSTVRWYLGEIRRQLKEGIEMNKERQNYFPQKLWCGHSGWVEDSNMGGLGRDLLVSNIAIACYGEPLTITEIARKLEVAAAYLENHLQYLVHMDYLSQIGSKYQTNFFIQTPYQILFQAKFAFENIGSYAEKVYQAVSARLDDISDLIILEQEIDSHLLLWTLIAFVTGHISMASSYRIPALTKLEVPKRKDGSEHWVDAGINDDQYWNNQTDFPAEVVDFADKSDGSGFKTRSASIYTGIQVETWLSKQYGIHWRDFSSDTLNKLSRIYTIISTQETPNENDKLIISEMVKLGYAKSETGISLLVPYIPREKEQQFRKIINDIYEELGKEFFIPYYEKFARLFEPEIPAFLNKDIITRSKYEIDSLYSVIAWIVNQDLIKLPSQDEAKAICTLVWESEK